MTKFVVPFNNFKIKWLWNSSKKSNDWWITTYSILIEKIFPTWWHFMIICWLLMSSGIRSCTFFSTNNTILFSSPLFIVTFFFLILKWGHVGHYPLKFFSLSLNIWKLIPRACCCPSSIKKLCNNDNVW